MKPLSPVRLCATPWTAAYQAPLSMGFSRQEYWSGVPLPSPKPEIEVAAISKVHKCFRLKGLEFIVQVIWYFPGGAVVQNLPANVRGVRDKGSIPGLGRSSGGGYGSPLQYSCLENSMDRRAWWATVHGLQRVGHDWVHVHAHAHAHTHTHTQCGIIKYCWYLIERLRIMFQES